MKQEPTLTSIAVTNGKQREKLESANLIAGFGIEDDELHDENRQISIASDKLFVNYKTNESGFCYKKFKENLIISHLDIKSLVKFDKFIIGESIIEITQVFKKCHSNCPNLKNHPNCQANKEVAFAKIVKNGHIKKGDTLIKL